MTGRRGMLGAAIVVAVALVAIVFQLDGGSDDTLVTVRGTIGSEKDGLLTNPEVRQILADRYGLRVEFAAAGSIELMENVPEDHDFLWPGTHITADARFDPVPNSEEIFYSPIVLYSWGLVTDALLAAGLVEQVDNTYYVTDFPRLIEMVDAGTTWEEIGLPLLPGQISITTSDPTTSNSGNSFVGLLASTYNDGRLIDDRTVDDVAGKVQAFYAGLGPLEKSSGFLFDQYVSQGMNAFPIIAGYESSVIEFKLQEEESLGPIQQEIRVLYPRPTVWSSHLLIALTPNGEKLLAALRDSDIQRLAWSQHGFRSGLFNLQDVPDILGSAGIPAIVDSVMSLPRAAVMDQIIEGLRAATPTAEVGMTATKPDPARRRAGRGRASIQPMPADDG